MNDASQADRRVVSRLDLRHLSHYTSFTIVDDNGARTSGISSGEIRRGFIRPRQLPYKRAFGIIIDSGHLRELLA
jgi:hypothetical protein